MGTSKIEKAVGLLLIRLSTYLRPSLSTRLAVRLYRRWGMNIEGTPNYISSKVWFDGTDYSMITLGHGCTISSYIRFLTHDWAPNTVFRGLGLPDGPPIGRLEPITVGPHSFIGTGSIVMPGCTIGQCSIVGSGTVVRGEIAPYSIVLGSPCTRVGDVRDYLSRRFPDEWAELANSTSDPIAPSRDH